MISRRQVLAPALAVQDKHVRSEFSRSWSRGSEPEPEPSTLTLDTLMDGELWRRNQDIAFTSSMPLWAIQELASCFESRYLQPLQTFLLDDKHPAGVLVELKTIVRNYISRFPLVSAKAIRAREIIAFVSAKAAVSAEIVAAVKAEAARAAAVAAEAAAAEAAMRTPVRNMDNQSESPVEGAAEDEPKKKITLEDFEGTWTNSNQQSCQVAQSLCFIEARGVMVVDGAPIHLTADGSTYEVCLVSTR